MATAEKEVNKEVTETVSVWRVLAKAVALFVVLNVLFVSLQPMATIGRISLYNRLLPGRQRLPYGDDPQHAYNLNLYSLEAMFASHVVAAPKAADEYRVFLIGDSSVWGFLLENADALSGQLNALGLQAPDGRRVTFYNLGHPTISLTKDLMLLDYAMQFEPDLIVWPVTLEAFPAQKQLASPLVQNNATRVRWLVAEYSLNVDVNGGELVEPDWWGQTIIGERRALADILRLQYYGVMWGATGIDVAIPDDIELRAVDLEADESYYGLQSPLAAGDLAFDVLAAGVERAGNVPVLIVNEPIFVSDGANSDVRYDAFYPRWAYDQYRELLAKQCAAQGWACLDLWRAADDAEFTNTAIHLTPKGEGQLARALAAELEQAFSLQAIY